LWTHKSLELNFSSIFTHVVVMNSLLKDYGLVIPNKNLNSKVQTNFIQNLNLNHWLGLPWLIGQAQLSSSYMSRFTQPCSPWLGSATPQSTAGHPRASNIIGGEQHSCCARVAAIGARA